MDWYGYGGCVRPVWYGMVLLVYYDWLSRVGHGSQQHQQQQSRRGCLSVCKCADWGGGVWTHVNDLGTECDTDLHSHKPLSVIRGKGLGDELLRYGNSRR